MAYIYTKGVTERFGFDGRRISQVFLLLLQHTDMCDVKPVNFQLSNKRGTKFYFYVIPAVLLLHLFSFSSFVCFLLFRCKNRQAIAKLTVLKHNHNITPFFFQPKEKSYTMQQVTNNACPVLIKSISIYCLLYVSIYKANEVN